MTAALHRLAGTLLIASLGACAMGEPPRLPRLDPVLAVVAWNLHEGRGDVARLLEDLTGGQLTDAVPVTAFVLLLQEVTTGEQREARALSARPGLNAYFGPVRRIDGRESGNAILSTAPLTAPRVIDLPRERQPRSAVAATIEVNGTPLFVVSAHLENRLSWTRGGLFSEGARGRQADALIRALPPDAPGIVGGDLNTWLGPREPAWRALLQRFPDSPVERPQPTFRDRLVLDHLFFDLPEGWFAARRVIRERYGSDHHPVLGVVYVQAG